jgi:hypothetical protein
MIEIEGKKYKVTENLGFQAGYQARMVDDNGKERVVVKRNGRWSWWTAEDKLMYNVKRGGYYDCV